VAALIIVLSVMNGFQKEVTDRMLSVVAHVEVFDVQGNALTDWHATRPRPPRTRRWWRPRPFIAMQSLIARGDEMRGAVVRGIDPAEEVKVTPLAAQMAKGGLLTQLQPGAWKIVLGGELARSLRVRVGDTVTLVAPGGQVTPAGTVPRLKSFTVAGTFDAGHYEYDSGLALIHLDDAAKLYRLDGATGVQLKLADLHQAPRHRQPADRPAARRPAGARLDPHQPQLV